ncbi:MAG: hypothetical protein FWD53_08240 [Phycisphaerales bacterium]|nr:hypothetical protein [Phycisphaerales bacterium]
MSPQPPILDYDSSQPTTVKFPTLIRLIVLLFILPALALPFVTFAGYPDWSPMDLVAEFFRAANSWDRFPFFTAMGLMLFVGIPLVLCHLRVLIFGELSKMEIWAGYIVAALGMASVATFLIALAIYNFTDLDPTVRYNLPIGTLLVPTVVIAFGTCVVWFLDKRVSHDTRIGACLCIPYTAGLLFWMIGIGLPYNLKFGFMLSLPVIVGNLIELTTLAVLAFRRG